MKKLVSVLLAAVLLCIACCSIAEETAQPEILAVYSSPEAQIITNDDQSKALADTVIFLYQDHSYVQYVDHESRYESSMWIMKAGTRSIPKVPSRSTLTGRSRAGRIRRRISSRSTQISSIQRSISWNRLTSPLT